MCSTENIINVCVCYLLSHVPLFQTLCTVAFQVPLSMEFSKQEYLSVLPFPSPGDLPNPEIERGYPALQVDSLVSKPLGKSMVNGIAIPFLCDDIWVLHLIIVINS